MAFKPSYQLYLCPQVVPALCLNVYIANMSELENSNGYLREDIQVDNITMDVNALQNC